MKIEHSFDKKKIEPGHPSPFKPAANLLQLTGSCGFPLAMNTADDGVTQFEFSRKAYFGLAVFAFFVYGCFMICFIVPW